MINTLFFLFFFISILVFVSSSDKIIKHSLFLSIGIILIIVAAFRNEADVVGDYSNYIIMFNNSDFNTEPAFILISALIHNFLFSEVIYLFIFYAILGVTLKFIAIRQLTEFWFLSILIYVSYFFILHELTQIRAGVAASFLLLCIKPIYERNLKYFLLFAILALSFHYSAILIFPLWFLGNKSRKEWLLFSVPISYLIYFSGINFIVNIGIPGIQEKIEMYKLLQELGAEGSNPINVFNLLFLARIIFFYILLWKYNLILKHNKYLPILIKIYCISLIALPVFAIIPVFGFRINEFFGVSEIILVPFLCYILKPVVLSKILIVFAGLSMLLIIMFYSKLVLF